MSAPSGSGRNEGARGSVEIAVVHSFGLSSMLFEVREGDECLRLFAQLRPDAPAQTVRGRLFHRRPRLGAHG